MNTPRLSPTTHTGRLTSYSPWLFSFFILLPILLLVVRCAKIEELEGGPKDTTPPQLIATYPIHGSTGFKDRKICLTFDKEIEIQDLHDRLIITPQLEKPTDKPSYTSKVQGNKVELHFALPLAPETTYTFSFTDAIVDTRERTAAVNPVLTFSTGDLIDAMYMTGKVNYLMTNQPAEHALVGLYKIATPDTTHILNSNPDYFTKTNQQGEFKIAHIKPGQYKVCAGHSTGKSLILDSEKDQYGFLVTPIDLMEPREEVLLSILEANLSELKLQSAQAEGSHFDIHFNRPIINYTIQLHGGFKQSKQVELSSHLVEKQQVIRIYNTMKLLEGETIGANLIAKDEKGGEIKQTIHLRFKSTTKQEPFRCAVKPAKASDALHIDISANKPFKNIYADRIYLLINQVDTLFLTQEDITYSPNHDVITIRKKVDHYLTSTQVSQSTAPPIELHFPKGALFSVEKEPNEPFTYRHTLKNEAEFGIISGKVVTQAPGFLIQLLNDKYEVIDTIHNQNHYQFNTLSPGSYQIRVLLLDKPDSFWHCGNINQLVPPDPVIFYPHTLNVAANWSLENIDVAC